MDDYDLWSEASRDVEAERSALRMAHAKVAVAGLWPFLALAQSQQEFTHRIALAMGRIEDLVPSDLLAPVVGSLTEDFRALAAKDAEGEESADDEDGDGKPDWLKEKIEKGSAFYHTGLGAWVAFADEDDRPSAQELAAAEPQSTEQYTTDPDEDGYFRDLGRSGPGDAHTHEHNASYLHVGRQVWVTAAIDQPEGGGNPYYFTGGPEAGPNTGSTNQYAPSPTQDPVDPINQMFPMQPTPWTVPPGGEWKEEPMNFSPPTNRTTSGRIAVAAGDTDTCSNCRNPVKAVRVSWGSGIDWTHIGSHGASADDDHPPFPERYSKSAGWRKLAEGVEGSPGPNPDYFSGGQEGATGPDGASFPQDLATEDPDDRVNELYGTSPISAGTYDDGSRVANRRQAQTWSGYAGDPEPDNPAPDSDQLQGTQFDSPQERQRWNRAQSGEQQDSRASNTFEGSRQFYDPNDPTVRVMAAGNPYGGPESTNPFGDASGFAPDSGGSTSQPGGAQNFTAPDMQGMTPQTTPPRQMPGGAPQPPNGSSSDQAAKGNLDQQVAASRHHADGFSRDLPSAEDPTGLGDEYREKTWNGPLTTRPRQSAEHRNVNTPQRPGAPIPTVSSPGEAGEEEEDEQRREASRVADAAVRELVGA